MRERINMNNYEEFLIDYLEGQLSRDDEAALMAFLEANPSVKAEFDLLSASGPVNKTVSETADFAFLKKPESIPVDQELLVARLEGDLTEQQQVEVDRNIAAYPEWQKEYRLFEMTRSIAANERFGDLSVLRRTRKAVILPLFRTYAAAAMILIIGIGAGLHLLIKQKKQTETAMLVQPAEPALQNVPSAEIGSAKTNTAGTDAKAAETLIRDAKMNTRLQRGVVPVQIAVRLLSSRSKNELPAKVNSEWSPVVLIIPVKENASVAITEPYNNETDAKGIQYLPAGTWLLKQIKDRTPGIAVALADSLSDQLKREDPAKSIVERVGKVAGIQFENRDKSDEGRRFSLVSKYFAFEHIEH